MNNISAAVSVVGTASRAKRDCFRDTNFHRRGCGPAAVSHICRRRRSDTLNFVFTCLCGFTDRLFHYACFLCRKIRPENNNRKNTSHHIALLSYTCTHCTYTHTHTPTHAPMNKYNIIFIFIVISYIL